VARAEIVGWHVVRRRRHRAAVVAQARRHQDAARPVVIGIAARAVRAAAARRHGDAAHADVVVAGAGWAIRRGQVTGACQRPGCRSSMAPTARRSSAAKRPTGQPAKQHELDVDQREVLAQRDPAGQPLGTVVHQGADEQRGASPGRTQLQCAEVPRRDQVTQTPGCRASWCISGLRQVCGGIRLGARRRTRTRTGSRQRRGLRARSAQLNGITHGHFDGALVVLRGREASQFAIAPDEPEGGRDDADADRRVTGLEPLQRGHRNAHAPRPRLQ